MDVVHAITNGRPHRHEAYITRFRARFLHGRRGRAYPIPPYLNHLGDDLSRGLLQFAHGRELGESGLRWLFIHVR